MARSNPHVEDVSYQHPAGYDRAAVRLVVYLFRRPDDKKNANKDSAWATVPKGRRLGDARAFVRAANERTRDDTRGRGGEGQGPLQEQGAVVHLLRERGALAGEPGAPLRR